jgi:hypothetical protein
MAKPFGATSTTDDDLEVVNPRGRPLLDAYAAVRFGHCAHLIILAETELSALMWVIEHSYGKAAAHTAGEYWVKELKSADLFNSREQDWRLFTIAALSRLVKDGRLPRPTTCLE